MVSGEERPASSEDPDGTRVLEVTWRTQNSRETRISGRRLGRNGEEASDGAATEPRVATQPAQQREAEGIERAIYGEHRGDVEPEGQSGEGGSREADDDHLDGRREGAADGDDGRAGEDHADERAPRPGVRVAAAAGDNGQDEAGVVEVDGRRRMMVESNRKVGFRWYNSRATAPTETYASPSSMAVSGSANPSRSVVRASAAGPTGR